MDNRKIEEILPNPHATHHILEDITNKFDGPAAHVALLRRFVENFVTEDLRSFAPISCARYVLTQIQADQGGMPLHCKTYDGKLDSVLNFQ